MPAGTVHLALSLLCLVGGVSSVVALIIGFIAPSQFGHSNWLLYALFVLGGITRDWDRSSVSHGSASKAGVDGRRKRADPRAMTSTRRLLK